jgi:DNA modification methylase
VIQLHCGNSLDVLATLGDDSVDSIVTDPPYGLSFMGRKWDYDVPSVDIWEQCLRVLKPGGHLLAFAGTRTQHRMAVNIEDAGFEIRDMLAWIYGSGFPKSMNVGKAIDKARRDEPAWRVVGAWLKAQREAMGHTRKSLAPLLSGHKNLESAAANVSNWENGLSFPTWERWEELRHLLGFGDAMDAEVWRLNGRKGEPGEAWAEREVLGTEIRYNEPSGIVAAGRDERTLIERKITAPATPEAQQWDGWGTALKPALEPITVARKPFKGTVANNVLEHGTGAINIDECRVEGRERTDYGLKNSKRTQNNTYGTPTASADFDASKGRWPANLIHDGSDEVTELFPQNVKGQVGMSKTQGGHRFIEGDTETVQKFGYGTTDTGSAARFFYCAKANKKDREDGNTHPTVKPTDLMRYLCRLVTPPGGIVLDPFMGSGSTGKAAMREGFSFIGIEREEEYVAIASKRLQVIQRSILASRSADQNG